jgi:hypothetical protein
MKAITMGFREFKILFCSCTVPEREVCAYFNNDREG